MSRDADHEMFRERALWIVSFSANPARGMQASQELRAYFGEVVAEKRRVPGDDLISMLIEAEIDGDRLSDEEIFAFLLFLLPAGVETTYRSTGNLLFALLSHPDQLAEVRADRTLLAPAIEEALRWEPPMLQIPRSVGDATTFAGVDVPAGTEVSYHIGAANRDDTRWDVPDAFDVHRPSQPHLAFGFGVHLCLGMHLARLEMATATNALPRPAVRAQVRRGQRWTPTPMSTGSGSDRRRHSRFASRRLLDARRDDARLALPTRWVGRSSRRSRR